MHPICYVDQFSRKKEKFRSVKANFFYAEKKGRQSNYHVGRKTTKKGLNHNF